MTVAITWHGVPIGNVGRARSCATLPKADIYALRDHFVLSETSHGQSRGFLTCSHRLKRRRKLASAR
jgi:hypothetical protein